MLCCLTSAIRVNYIVVLIVFKLHLPHENNIDKLFLFRIPGLHQWLLPQLHGFLPHCGMSSNFTTNVNKQQIMSSFFVGSSIMPAYSNGLGSFYLRGICFFHLPNTLFPTVLTHWLDDWIDWMLRLQATLVLFLIHFFGITHASPLCLAFLLPYYSPSLFTACAFFVL